MKRYKAIFFDWDGTAVLSRKAPVDRAVQAMKPLLSRSVKLVIVSGTTYENIAGGKLEECFTKEELQNLYLGLGRGAYNYAFDNEGRPYVFADCMPSKEKLLDIHRMCFAVHEELLQRHDLTTDIVFSRPNYCKIDLMVGQQRGDNLFMQEDEIDILRKRLEQHGIQDGLRALMELAEKTGVRYGIKAVPTCDAKYLEVGISSKSDNADTILGKLESDFGISAADCSFWGDEYVGAEAGIYGSDSYMLTSKTAAGDFFDVSSLEGERPLQVQHLGGGIERFLGFLREQAM